MAPKKKLKPLNDEELITNPIHRKSGIDTPWYKGWKHLTADERSIYRDRTLSSNLAKKQAEAGTGKKPVHDIYKPKLNLNELMPQIKHHGYTSLSLFSGGGGMDLGFDKAGFKHLASYELLDFAADTIRLNRPLWEVHSGQEGDVTKIDWKKYEGKVDVIHGGPPCQPFSVAGNQNGKEDPRDMFPQFVRCVDTVKPSIFIAENVAGLTQEKFSNYLNLTLIKPLSRYYDMHKFFVNAASFGVPQNRKRIIFVGIRKGITKSKYIQPIQTHNFYHLLKEGSKQKKHEQLDLFSQLLPLAKKTMGVRQALGLPDIGIDFLSPTVRCALTGPRHTTSILSSVAALKTWNCMQIWPNGVAQTRDKARAFVPVNLHFRLSVPECALIQGFPEEWVFDGPVYKSLGQIGNAVPPPMSYAIAKSILSILKN